MTLYYYLDFFAPIFFSFRKRSRICVIRARANHYPMPSQKATLNRTTSILISATIIEQKPKLSVCQNTFLHFKCIDSNFKPPKMSIPTKEQVVPQSLGLEDGNDTDDQPRRFLRLPSGHLLAYGGDNGNVSCLNANTQNQKFVIVQRYEDAVRCIAVSKDGKRLAVGFDTGKTLIYSFDEFNCKDGTAHPYAKALEKAQSAGGAEDDFLLSQDFGSTDDDFDSFAGPDLGAPARDMLFIPQKTNGSTESSVKDPYMLAIASEAGMFVIDITNKEIMDGCEHWLEKESKESHDQCGIRGLDASIIKSGSNKTNEGSDIIVLASLAMDGRLCLWDFTNKKLLQREDTPCVAKKDVGEIHDADAFDRSCRPTIFCRNSNDQQKSDLVIATPGKLMPYSRIFELQGDEAKINYLDDSSFEIDKDTEEDHIQPIVTIMFCSGSLLVTSGQDGRLLLWSSRESSSDSVGSKWKVVQKFQMESPATDLCLRHQNEDTVSLLAACANGSLQAFDISNYFYQVEAKKVADGIDKKQTSVSDVEKSKALGAPNKSPFGDDSDEDDSIAPSSPKAKNVHFLDEAEEDDVQNSVGNITEDVVAPESAGRSDDFNDYSDEEDGNSLVNHGLVPKTSGYMDIVKPQPAFSPSSTPLDLTRRFLCWNHIGSVTLLQGDNNRNIIDINFADSAFKRPISFTDNINFIIGSVGESGGIFASDTKEDEDLDGEEIDGLDGFNMSERTKQAVLRDRKKSARGSENSKPTGSSIFFYRFNTSGLVNRKNKDWHMILPDGERVLGAACGDGWAAAVTR